MLWQTPALALTAQAFLLTVALNEQASVLPRVVTAILGLLVAAASMQLMAKHRLLESVDRAMLTKLEEALGLPQIAERRYYDSRRGTVDGESATRIRSSWWRRRRSYVIWQIMLGAFLLANLTAIVAAVLASAP